MADERVINWPEFAQSELARELASRVKFNLGRLVQIEAAVGPLLDQDLTEHFVEDYRGWLTLRYLVAQLSHDLVLTICRLSETRQPSLKLLEKSDKLSLGNLLQMIECSDLEASLGPEMGEEWSNCFWHHLRHAKLAIESDCARQARVIRSEWLAHSIMESRDRAALAEPALRTTVDEYRELALKLVLSGNEILGLLFDEAIPEDQIEQQKADGRALWSRLVEAS